MQKISIVVLLLVIALSFGLHTTAEVAADSPTQSGEPRITSFTSSASSVDRVALSRGTVRIPVQWTTINRPLFATLFFEQVLPDGQVVNVELPRDTPWVNSNDRGVVAPIAVGDAPFVRLRVRLYNLLVPGNLDMRELTIPIRDNNQVNIISYASSVTNVSRSSLANQSARIPVTWAVANRRNNQNLVFEQVMPNGELRNVELPRTDPIVASAGTGVAAPFAVDNNYSHITLRLTVYDLNTGARLTYSQFNLSISDSPPDAVVESGDTCLQSPYLPTRNIAIGSRLYVNTDTSNTYPVLAGDGPDQGVAGYAYGGDLVEVLQGPVCYRFNSNPGYTTRQWRVRNLSRAGVPEGWMIEYQGREYFGQLIFGNTGDDNYFRASNSSPNEGDTISLEWNKPYDGSLRLVRYDPINGNSTIAENLGNSGSRDVTLPEGSRTVIYSLVRPDDSLATPNGDIVIAVNCRYADMEGSNAVGTNRCPSGEPSTVQAAYQPFERGYMLWFNGTIYVFYTSGSGPAGEVYQDSFVEGQTELSFAPESIPANRFVPVRGFGKVWNDHPAVRERIGWATAPESGYSAQLQNIYSTGSNPYLVVKLPDGNVVTFSHNFQSILRH